MIYPDSGDDRLARSLLPRTSSVHLRLCRAVFITYLESWTRRPIYVLVFSDKSDQVSARVYLHWMSPQFISPRLTTISSTPPRLRTGGGGLSRERLSSHARSFYYLPKPPTLPGRARGACPSVARPRAFLARRKLVPLRVGGTRKRINPEHISNVSRRAPVNLICFRAREQLKHTCTVFRDNGRRTVRA